MNRRLQINKNVLFAYVLSITTQFCVAQTDFRPGFVVKKSGDTLHGEIDYRGDMTMKSDCRFQAQKGGTETVFSPDELISFRFKESKYFVSRVWKEEKLFLEYLINGKVSIYYYRDKEGDHYLIDKEGVKMSEFPKEEEIVSRNGKQYFQKPTKHINLLGYYMSDAPELFEKIKNVQKAEHQPLIRIAQQYHTAICKDKTCVIYEKKQPIIKINPEATAGFIRFHDEEYLYNIENKQYIVGGVLANIWLPRSNEKLYFRTGLLYASVNRKDGTKVAFYKIPLHLCYQLPTKNIIKPFASIGLLTPSYAAGLMFKINKQLNIGLQGWLDFSPQEKIPLIPQKKTFSMTMANISMKF
jgi:hypothetical protein